MRTFRDATLRISFALVVRRRVLVATSIETGRQLIAPTPRRIIPFRTQFRRSIFASVALAASVGLFVASASDAPTKILEPTVATTHATPPTRVAGHCLTGAATP